MARGSLRKRYPGRNGQADSWSIVLELGHETDPTTGIRRRRQKCITFHGNKKQAEAKLTALLGAAHDGTFVEPSKITLIDWLRQWLDKSVKPPMRRPATHQLYTTIVEHHISKSTLALIPLQRLRGTDLERYLADLTGAASSIAVHRAVLHRSLAKAVRDRLLTANPASDIEYRRSTADQAAAARLHCWTATETRAFLAAAASEGPQTASFMRLAIDSGARRNELLGLGWEHLDLDAGTLAITRQLDKAGVEPEFGPTKTKRARTISLGAETLAALRVHRTHQLELRLKNGGHYHHFGLIFAKEPEDLQTPKAALGQPLSTLGGTRFVRLVAKAGIKRIKFHGCRHTCATLLLQQGVPPHVVAARLGHSTTMLLTTYAHVVPGMQQDAADRLGALLHG